MKIKTMKEAKEVFAGAVEKLGDTFDYEDFDDDCKPVEDFIFDV